MASRCRNLGTLELDPTREEAISNCSGRWDKALIPALVSNALLFAPPKFWLRRLLLLLCFVNIGFGCSHDHSLHSLSQHRVEIITTAITTGAAGRDSAAEVPGHWLSKLALATWSSSSIRMMTCSQGFLAVHCIALTLAGH